MNFLDVISASMFVWSNTVGYQLNLLRIGSFFSVSDHVNVIKYFFYGKRDPQLLPFGCA